jgi:hypothetical protein
MADEIRTDTSPEAMVRAIEDNTLDYWRLMATSGVIWIEEADDLITVGAVEKPSAFRDSVLRTQFSDIDVEERIDTTLTGLGWPGAGLIWWQPPSSTPADMPERLLWRGFQRENDFPGLAIEIERLRPDEPRPGLEIEVVRDREQMVVASETMAAGLERPARIQRIFHEMYCGVGFDNPRFPRLSRAAGRSARRDHDSGDGWWSGGHLRRGGAAGSAPQRRRGDADDAGAARRGGNGVPGRDAAGIGHGAAGVRAAGLREVLHDPAVQVERGWLVVSGQ